MKRIGIDQDQVVADILYEWLKRYNEDYNDNIQRHQLTHWNWHKLTKPSCQEKVYEYLDDPNLFECLPVIEGSQEIIYKLSKRYEIFFITSPFNPNNVVPKYNWLRKHFDFIPVDNYVFTRNKSICNPNYLIDDKPSNFDIKWSGIPLLFDAPHNQTEDRFKRVKNWKEIANYFHV